jgi:AcrR family transcriptional regulator
MSEPDRSGLGTDEGRDPLREQLLEAAARVFVEKGYAGTKVMDVVKEAGLSSGALYGRFNSKNDLLVEVVARAVRRGTAAANDDRQVADVVADMVAQRHGALTDAEAMRLEAYVAARREPEVAKAIREARRRRRVAAEPVIQRALADGSVAPGSDIESILYFLETLNLGLLLQRAAGAAPPDPEEWGQLVRSIIAGLASRDP